MKWQEHISTDPKIMFGKPCIKGTRIPVDLIVEKLGYGETMEYLLTAYPKLKKEDLLACLLFAADSVRNEIIYAA